MEVKITLTKEQLAEIADMNRSQVRRLEQEVLELRICMDYMDGANTVEIARNYATSSPSICHILKRRGVQIRSMKEARGGLSENAEKEVCRRYLEGETMTELHGTFEVSMGTIHEALKRNGVRTRVLSDQFRRRNR